MTSLHSARSRLARLRNDLHNQLAALKSGSTIYKQTKGRLGGVMDCIQILDEEMLAGEQGKACDVNDAILPGEPMPMPPRGIRPDQVAWLEKRRGNE